MAAFRLSKWYLDCVTDSGNASILYTGSANWGPFRLNYSSAIESSGALISTRYSLRIPQEPEPGQDKLRWNSESLGIEGEWEVAGKALRATVFASEKGTIEWHCIVPCGAARIGNRHGLGYVEHLDMTVSPWALPIRTLRWGRFTSETDWVVWIEWRGDDLRTMAWRNGSLVLVRCWLPRYFSGRAGCGSVCAGWPPVSRTHGMSGGSVQCESSITGSMQPSPPLSRSLLCWPQPVRTVFPWCW